MSRNHPQAERFRQVAAALVAALSFLFVASYLVLPCMTRDVSQFQDVGSPNSCTENRLFKPQADLRELFKSLTPETPFRPSITPALVVMPFLIALMLRPIAHDRLRRRRRSRTARLPFVTAAPPKLPQFAALRDA